MRIFTRNTIIINTACIYRYVEVEAKKFSKKKSNLITFELNNELLFTILKTIFRVEIHV